MASLLLVALLLSGCQIGNTKVVFLKPVGYHQVFKIDKEVCKKKEAKVYLTNYMNIYGNAYGVSLRIRTGRFRAVCERFDNITAF